MISEWMMEFNTMILILKRIEMGLANGDYGVLFTLGIEVYESQMISDLMIGFSVMLLIVKRNKGVNVLKR